jgi:hypothetical protein
MKNQREKTRRMSLNSTEGSAQAFLSDCAFYGRSHRLCNLSCETRPVCFEDWKVKAAGHRKVATVRDLQSGTCRPVENRIEDNRSQLGVTFSFFKFLR